MWAGEILGVAEGGGDGKKEHGAISKATAEGERERRKGRSTR